MPAKKRWGRKISNSSATRPGRRLPDVWKAPVAVSPAPAANSVKAMFDGIAPQYDRFNAWASLGLHQYWRKQLIQRVPEGARVLDIATGTGDVAIQAKSQGYDVVGLDFSAAMIERAREKDSASGIRWTVGSADKLPFSDQSFGCITSAFALRNFWTSLDKVFKENFRVLKRGGKVLHMDFGRPDSAFFRWGHKMHLTYSVPRIGQWLCGKEWPNGYLESTIDQFHEPGEIKRRLLMAGFENVSQTPLMWGIIRIYEGTKC